MSNLRHLRQSTLTYFSAQYAPLIKAAYTCPIYKNLPAAGENNRALLRLKNDPVQISAMRFFYFLLYTSLLTGCLLPDTQKKSTDSTISQLSGLYSGTTDFYPSAGVATEGIVTLLLFVEDTAYLLRTDEAYVGTYTQDGLGGIKLTMTPYTYGNADTTNNVYSGTAAANAVAQEFTAVLTSGQGLVASYTSTLGAGYLDLSLDTDRAGSVTLAAIEGSWKSTDQVQDINANGRFLNYNTADSCQTDGQLISNGALYDLNMTRINCVDMAGDAEGLGFLLGTGELNYVARSSNNLLWMQFDPDVLTNASSTTTTTSP